MKLIFLILTVILGLFLLLEAGLRLIFGFGDPLIYLADEKIGYLLVPDQQVRRFGNRIAINQFSMRSDKTTSDRPAAVFRVLLLGDSVANGGWWTDQTETISEMLRQQIQEQMGQQQSQAFGFEAVETLNASANSWGPRNELAYLQQFGSFQAQVVVLILNTDDLFAIAPTSLPVGRDLNYPNQKPRLAIAELLQRYLLPPAPDPELAKVQNEPGDRVGFNLTAIETMHTIVQENQGHFFLVMTPLLREVQEPGPRDYELKTRQRLLEFTLTQDIHYIDFLPIFKATDRPEDLYRDHIHLSPQGNFLVSRTIADIVNNPKTIQK